MGCLLVISVAYAKSIKPLENVIRTNSESTTRIQETITRLPLRVEPSVRGTISKKTHTPTQPYTGKTYTKDEVRGLIISTSQEFGIDSTIPLEIARCESNFNYVAKNRNSSASGVFQYLSGTFSNTIEGKAGLSPFDADANVRAAIRHMSVHGFAPWFSSKSCWK